MSAVRSWVNQFGEEYAIPSEILRYPGIVDQSWGNDAAPSFTLKRYERDGDMPTVVLWVEHPVAESREIPDARRFLVCAGHSGAEFYNGDDVNAALAALEKGC